MRLFGLQLPFTKASPPPGTTFSTPANNRGWFRILEPFAGAWQRNIEATTENVLSFHAVYACVTLIASDVAKLRIKLVEQDADGIWNETESPAFSPVLRTPNHFQTRIQFVMQWMLSKLIHGNAYALKARDNRGVVTSLYVLDPTRVKPLVAQNGDVYYALQQDDLSRVTSNGVTVPASEIIHDLMPALYHPLCGVSPITACYLPVLQALRAQQNSANFFANGSKPGGILTAPRILSDEEVLQITKNWEENFSGDNQGRVAVLGADLKYQDLGVVNAVDSQLIEQLKLSGENVCSAYHVPPYKVGIGAAPSYNNVQALNIQYYADCVQIHIESIEALLDKGLGIEKPIDGRRLGTEFDLDDLFRMDTATLVKAVSDAIGSGGMSPNEARKKYLGLGPTDGGEGPYLQQQNYSLAALAKRDAQADPFATDSPAPTPVAAPADDDEAKRFTVELRKAMEVWAA